MTDELARGDRNEQRRKCWRKFRLKLNGCHPLLLAISQPRLAEVHLVFLQYINSGDISIEDGSGLVSVLEVVEGMRFDRGFLSEPLRRIVRNPGEEPSVILNKVEESSDHDFGYSAPLF